MIKKYYTSEPEREEIIVQATNKGYILIKDVAYVSENYLEFDTNELETIEQLQNENADLLFKNATQDATIQALQNENSEIIFKIAQMEVGV